ncbi:MAG: hypothetical protein WCE75_15340 [Terracidiphilus sp.]
MPQPAANPTSPDSSSFAGLLAALAAPPRKPASAWLDDGLEDDVATLSYERALRTHARYRPACGTDQSLTQPMVEESAAQERNIGNARAGEARELHAGTGAQATVPGLAMDRKLKCASITIRMSQAESRQLRQRAAEAGMTVSAYLRSCTFEAESLRALVKETMAQLKAAASAEKSAEATRPRRWWPGWLSRLLTPWAASRA